MESIDGTVRSFRSSMLMAYWIDCEYTLVVPFLF